MQENGSYKWEEKQLVEEHFLVIQMLDVGIHATVWLYLKTLC